MNLNCHTYFSFRYGTISPENLVKAAKQQGIRTLTLTDINNTSAWVSFVNECRKQGIKPLVGVDFRVGIKQHYIAVAQNNEGFYEINKHLSKYLANEVILTDTAPDFEHAYVIYPLGQKAYHTLKENEFIGVAVKDLPKIRILAPYHDKMVACQPVTFLNQKGVNVHRLLRAIDNNMLLSKLPKSEEASREEILIDREDMLEAYREFPFLTDNAKQIENKCFITHQTGQNNNIEVYSSSKEEDRKMLRRLSYEGFSYRYGKGDPKLIERLEHELKLIQEMNYNSYFLINWDIVRFAREKGFYHIGRGSGANSMVAYCLKITDVDPMDLDLYFERFINPYRSSPPDFDIDFSWKDRDEVVNYIFSRYGKNHTALLATYATFQEKAIVRELSKVFGLPKHEADQLIEKLGRGETIENIDGYAWLIARYSKMMKGFPSHLNIHAGGVVISEKPIYYHIATHVPPKGLPVTHFSMLEAEDIGLYKFDILSQRGLGHIKDTLAIVKESRGEDIDIHNIKKFKEDEEIKKHLRKGKTLGCFYVESPAMRMLLKKLGGDTYASLVAASSIIRPGVAKSGMMREYVHRFNNQDKFEYLHPKIKELLGETFGIMVYQEDVIKVAHYFVGLSLAEADVLRRGMSGKFRSRSEFKKVAQQFFIKCKEREYPDKMAQELWMQIESFAGYSFSKGHSASYAVESYQSLYLKSHYPLEFMVGVINNFGGFYQTEVYVHEAKNAGAHIELPCINNSDYLTTIDGQTIYLGFVHIQGLEQELLCHLVQERRNNGSYQSLENFIDRVHIGLEQAIILIRIGAFRFTRVPKKNLLWKVHMLLKKNNTSTDLSHNLFQTSVKDHDLPNLEGECHEDAFDEQELLGFSVSSTPFDLIDKPPTVDAKIVDLRNEKKVNHIVEIVGYLVNIKNTRTSKDQSMHFGTFLNREGEFFDTTHFPNIARQFPFRGKGCYHIKGKLAHEFGHPSIEVMEMKKLANVHDPVYG